MTLTEAIIHAEAVADNKDELARSYHTDEGVYLEEETRCRECAEEHRQLAEWLKDYQRLLSEKEPKTEHWEDCSNGWMCSKCKTDHRTDTKYCPNCGARMVNHRKVRMYERNIF